MSLPRLKRKLAILTGMHLKFKKLSTWNSEDLRTTQILNTFGFNKVLDIGANKGQFSEPLFDFGYEGEIISFEPTREAYEVLKQKVTGFPKWHLAEKSAIGDKEGKIEMNISKNSVFNSVKKISEDYSEYNPESSVIGTEEVDVFTVDSLKGKYFDENDRIFLKIDTQGYEQEVLRGATNSLKFIKGIKIEMPLQSVYDEVSWDMMDMLSFFKDKGFECISLSEVAVNKKTGIVHEMDGIFIEKELFKSIKNN